MPVSEQDLIAWVEQHGWSKGVAYSVAQKRYGKRYRVCVLCGWAWVSETDCVNPDCDGFCTWGERVGAVPDLRRAHQGPTK